MTWHDEETNVKVITGGEYVPWTNDTPEQPQRERTDAQKHTDAALDNADQQAVEAATTFGQSLAWAESVGVEIPKWAREMVTRHGQWQRHLEDERKRRG